MCDEICILCVQSTVVQLAPQIASGSPVVIPAGTVVRATPNAPTSGNQVCFSTHKAFSQAGNYVLPKPMCFMGTERGCMTCIDVLGLLPDAWAAYAGAERGKFAVHPRRSHQRRCPDLSIHLFIHQPSPDISANCCPLTW